MGEARVIGKPVSHSLSPAIFSFLGDKFGRSDFHYVGEEVDPLELCDWTEKLRGAHDFIGFNVTIPHKESICLLCDELSSEAMAIGAVNTVKRNESGSLKGHNTDVEGVIKTLVGAQTEIMNSTAVVFGAGGAARAGAHALGILGAKRVLIINRSLERAEKLVESISPRFPKTKFAVFKLGEWTAEIKNVSLVINATPSGMQGVMKEKTGFEDLLRLQFAPDALAFDMVYRPLWTDFLQTASVIGLKPVGGLQMLIYQALAAWEIWFSEKISSPDLVSELAILLKKKLTSDPVGGRPVFLTGFMGSGKSTVARELASQLGWKFFDIDQWIEKKMNQTVADIFKDHGEVEFRKMEAEAIQELSCNPRSVIALGGGSLMNIQSLELIERAGFLVFLNVSKKTILDRTTRQSQKRPLLQGLDLDEAKAKISELYDLRMPHYKRAKLQIEADGLSADALAREISRDLIHVSRECQE